MRDGSRGGATGGIAGGARGRPPAPPRGRRRAAGWVAAVAAVAAAAFAFRAPILAGAARAWVVDDSGPAADALLVLGGDMQTRLPHAVGLHLAGVAPTILLADERNRAHRPEFRPLFLGPAEQAAIIYGALGVAPPTATVPSLKGGATSTRDEAEDLAAYAKARGLRRVTLVTSMAHARRARLAFRRALAGTVVEVRVAAAPSPLCAVDDWWRDEAGLAEFLPEPPKTLAYWLWGGVPSAIRNR